GNEVLAAQRLQPRQRLLAERELLLLQRGLAVDGRELAPQVGGAPRQRGALGVEQRALLIGAAVQAALARVETALYRRLGAATGRCLLDRQHEQRVALAHRLAFV